jgi:hypothetical protein
MSDIAILFNSYLKENIIGFIDNVEKTATNPKNISIIINIDLGNKICKSAIEDLQSSSPIKIKFIETNIIKSFSDVWKTHEYLINQIDKEVYFAAIVSDEVRFKTKGWDKILLQYKSYYEDDIFRIRFSKYRFRNYYDFWECVYAPDSTAFYTAKWLKISGANFHCDSWQQLVAFYLINSRKFDHIQYNRDIVDAFISIEGEGSGSGLSLLESRRKNIENVKLWFEAVSWEVQQKAKHSAAKLQAGIITHRISNQRKISSNFVNNRKPPIFIEKTKNITFTDNLIKKRIEFYNDKKLVYKIDYKISRIKLFLINNFRKINYAYYSGGGFECKKINIVNLFYTYYRIRKYGDFGYKEFINITSPKWIDKFCSKGCWQIIKGFLSIFKILWILLLKITFSKKYYRFVRRKIKKNAK